MSVISKFVYSVLLFSASITQSEAREAIRVDHGGARLIEFPMGVQTVIVGDAGVIQLTLLDDKTIVINGLAVGITNLIALTRESSVPKNYQIIVDENQDFTTTIFRGENAQRLSCSPRCRPI